MAIATAVKKASSSRPPTKPPVVSAPAGDSSPPPSRRRGFTPLTPMRVQAAKSMSKLADSLSESHPDMTVHQHVRDAARMLRAGNEEAAQRHLRAAAFSLSPQSLMRHGLHTDDAHVAARQAVHGVHRHILLVKDIADADAKNQAAIRRDSYGDDATSNPPPKPADPNAGYGPGALAQKPTARQPGGDKALNAPAKADGGGSDPAAADPNGPQPGGSKQFAYGWDDIVRVIALTGDGHGHHVAGTPMVYTHGFHPIDGTEVGKDGIRRPGGGGKVAKAAGAVPKARAPEGLAGGAKSIVSGSHPADRLTVSGNPRVAAKGMGTADLKGADAEFSRRAALLGKPGQVSKAHKAVRDELASREAAGAAGPKALSGDAAYDRVPEVSGKKDRDTAEHYSVASARVNAPLRRGDKVSKQDAPLVRNMDSLFARSEPTKTDMTAYRGTVGSLFGKGDATGTRFTDKGFTSVSTDHGQAVQFGPEGDTALMEIRIPAGSKVVKPGSASMYSTGDDQEKELVLNRGGQYEITGDEVVNHPQYGKIRKLTATYRGSA